ncbi:unnamed protein product [Closterium sp. NIES-65]|nr:unnamed protein product [Closterium sp. NIES-65]
MANDALALVATALAEASPGGVPGDQLQRFRRPHRRPARPPRSGLRPVPLSPQSPPQPVQTPLQAPVTPSAPPPRSVPEPLVVPSPPVASAWGMGEGEAEPPPEAASDPPGSAAAVVSVASAATPSSPAAAASSTVAATSVSDPIAPLPPAASAAAASPPVVSCSSGASRCAGVEVGGMLPSEQSAAVSAAREMLHYLPLIGLVQGAPGAALGPGPGAMLRLAESAQGAPLGLVSAAASVLRWMDGRLCWILSE